MRAGGGPGLEGGGEDGRVERRASGGGRGGAAALRALLSSSVAGGSMQRPSCCESSCTLDKGDMGGRGRAGARGSPGISSGSAEDPPSSTSQELTSWPPLQASRFHT